MNGHQKQQEQSRQMIEDAFFSRLREKEYAKITVSELTERATVARRTFYRLYERKEDVILHYFERLFALYYQEHTTLQRYDVERIAKEYFTFWYSYREPLLLLQKNGLDYMIYSAISNASEKIVKHRIPDVKLEQDLDLHFFIDYSTGGFLQLLCRWLQQGMEGDPEEYARAVGASIKKYIDPVPKEWV